MQFRPVTDEEVEDAAERIRANERLGDQFARSELSVAQACRLVAAINAADVDDQAIVVGRITPPAGAPRFFDPVEPRRAPDIVLRRNFTDGAEQFTMDTHVGYSDDRAGVVVVPARRASFDSDLTSVPGLFTWLVPRTGDHLPAALVHDGLVYSKGEPRTYVGPDVTRTDADRIFRDGMRELGTGGIRRWLIWTAVATATAWSDPKGRWRWYWRVVIGFTVAVVATLGFLATIDLFDCRHVLFWMGDRPLAIELLGGAVAAFVVPSLLAALWVGQHRAGWILGVGLAFLLHVTVALTFLYSLYVLAEDLSSGRWQRKRSGQAALGVVGAGVLPVILLVLAC